MISPPPTSSRYWLSYAFRLALTAALLAALVLFNARYFFHTQLYESGDLAADTLSVLRAAHFQELHGPYARGDFRQPGPALFYGEALGEATFFRARHLTPTPFNAQMLFVVGMLVSFFAAGISVAARWVRGWTFAVLALAFAALHFAMVGGGNILLSAWPAHLIPLLFFCFLVAAASVGAGQGEDLPLLVLAGGLLIHLSVAQPAFVLPIGALAYLGLAWSGWRCRARYILAAVPVTLAKSGDVAPASVPAPAAKAPGRFRRFYRGSHLLASLIAFVFALPILIEACFPHGNVQRAWEHLWPHAGGQTRPWLDSLGYVLDFAAYKPSFSDRAVYVAPDSGKALVSFVSLHLPVFLLWLGALLSPLLPLAARLWRGRDPVLLGTAPPTEITPGGYVSPAGRWRFLGWLWAVWLGGVVFTFARSHQQPGTLFYDDAWFVYALWYALALLAAGSVADALDTLVSRADYPQIWKGIIPVGCAVLAAVVVRQHPERFRATEADSDLDRAQAQTVADILYTEPAGTPHEKLLLFPHDGWPAATGVAALLARRGATFYVLPEWQIVFGKRYALPKWREVVDTPANTNPRFDVWHFVPRADAAVGEASAQHLVTDGYTLVPGGQPIDPAQNATITWIGDVPNDTNYAVQGWSGQDAPDAGQSRRVGSLGIIQFRAVPVPTDRDVRLTFWFRPGPTQEKGEPLRLLVRYNGHDLGALPVQAAMTEQATTTIPAATWNRYTSGLLTLKFPGRPSVKSKPAEGAPSAFVDLERIQFTLTGSEPTQIPALPGTQPPTEPAPASTAPAEPAVMPPATPPPAEQMQSPVAPPGSTPEPSPATPMIPLPESSPTPAKTPSASPLPEAMPETSLPAEPTPAV